MKFRAKEVGGMAMVSKAELESKENQVLFQMYHSFRPPQYGKAVLEELLKCDDSVFVVGRRGNQHLIDFG